MEKIIITQKQLNKFGGKLDAAVVDIMVLDEETLHKYEDAKIIENELIILDQNGQVVKKIKIEVEENKMKNIKQIIENIEAGKVELESLDPSYHEIEYVDGASDHYIAHTVEGHEELEVFFEEHGHIKEVRNDIYENGKDEVEAFEELVINEYADQYDYDNVIAIRVGQELEWI